MEEETLEDPIKINPGENGPFVSIEFDPELDGGGSWQLVDPTGMADPAETVKIGIGRDAADVSFLTTFGMSDFKRSSVSVTRIDQE